MQQKASVPIIAVAVIVLIGVVFVLYKQFAAPPAAGNAQTSPLPDFIDPVTKMPKAGVRGSSQGSPSGMPPGGGPPPGPGAPGGGPASGGAGGQ